WRRAPCAPSAHEPKATTKTSGIFFASMGESPTGANGWLTLARLRPSSQGRRRCRATNGRAVAKQNMSRHRSAGSTHATSPLERRVRWLRLAGPSVRRKRHRRTDVFYEQDDDLRRLRVARIARHRVDVRRRLVEGLA